MAVQLYCPECNKPFSISASLLGEEMKCPNCGHCFPSQSREDLFEQEARLIEEEGLQQKEPEPEKEPVIEQSGRIDLGPPEPASSSRISEEPQSQTVNEAPASSTHFNPDAPSRYLRLRALSELFLVFAYLQLLLMAMGGALTIYLKLTGYIDSLAVLLMGLVGWSVMGGLFYLALKLAGELTHLFADIGDQQRDQVSLLLDIREKMKK